MKEKQLAELITIFDQVSSSSYQTSDEQKISILEGRQQITEGIYFTNEQAETKINEWLCKE